MTKLNYFTIVIIVVFFLSPVFSFAQNIDPLTITVSPQNPEPLQTISATVSALSFNIDLAKISWSLDGKSIIVGQGQKSIALKAPAAGKSSTLSVSVTPQGGVAMTKSIAIAPGGDVDLIWEAIDGYTPPFYRGKTLAIKQSAIKVVAMPNVKTTSGASAKASDFVYTWRKDGANQAGQSGLGNNSLVFANQILDTTNRVEVSATNGLKTVANSITITPFVPEIVFYEYDQLRNSAKYQDAFDPTNGINQPRLTVVAEPYFLAKDWKINKDITFNWSINGQQAKAGEKNTLGIITAKGNIDVQANYNETKKLFRDIKASIRFIMP